MSELDEKYYVLTSFVSRSTARFENEPRFPDGNDLWIDGTPLTFDVPRPVVFEIEPGDEGEMGAFIETAIPLMSDALLAVLRKCGVDNLEVHDAVITELATGRQYTDYRAVNIIGAIDAVDRSKSSVTSLEGLGNWINDLALDESATRGALMFRLSESLSKVIVHRKVKEAIEAEQLPLIYFRATTGLSG